LSNSYIYCFIRRDIPPVHQIIQMAHAAFEIGNYSDPVNTPNIVLFEVDNEYDLKIVGRYLEIQDIQYCPFREPDMNNELTSICTRIVTNKRERELFKDFNLYK
jgi:hypothetical protein